MTTSFMIPFDKILEKSFELRENNPDMTIEEILKEVMSNINIQLQSDIPISIRKKTNKKTNKVDNDASGEPKSYKKKEIADEERCMARTIYEDIHLDNGILKVMRDDSKNLYGDRCKYRKKVGGNRDFCTRHYGWQSLGVWNGSYSGKFEDYVKKILHPEECLIDLDEKPIKKSSTPKKKQDAPSGHSVCKEIKDNKKNTPKEPEPIVINEEELDDDDNSIDAEPINIDGNSYYIDSDNNLYSKEGDEVGIYDRKNNKIITT